MDFVEFMRWFQDNIIDKFVDEIEFQGYGEMDHNIWYSLLSQHIFDSTPSGVLKCRCDQRIFPEYVFCPECGDPLGQLGRTIMNANKKIL